MYAIFLAALALAGAPSTATVQCVGPEVVGANWGETIPGQQTVSLLSQVCTDLSSRGPGRRGVALLVMLHEARHLTGDMDECRVERYAIRNVPALISRFVPRAGRARALAAARTTDSGLGEQYQVCRRPSR